MRHDEEPNVLTETLTQGPRNQKVSLEDLIEEVRIQYGILPQVAVAEVWYKAFLKSNTNIHEFVRQLWLNDVKHQWEWAETGDPEPRKEVEA